MKKVSSLAVLEFSDIPAGIYAVDVILKKAPIAFVRAGTVTRGRYLVVFGGSTASTGESLEAARALAGDAVLDSTFLPDVHPALFESLSGVTRRADGSLLIVETETASSIVRAAEAALKGTGVELMQIRLADEGLAGKGVATFAGPLHEVEAAAALAAAGSGADSAPPRGFRFRLIAAPHLTLEQRIQPATPFDEAPLLELDGERG